jgi:hypothetical protein
MNTEPETPGVKPAGDIPAGPDPVRQPVNPAPEQIVAPLAPVKRDKTAVYVLLLLAVVLITAGLFFYLKYTSKGTTNVDNADKKEEQSVNTPSPSPTGSEQKPVSDEPVIESTGIPNQKKFTSNKYKLSFLFLAKNGDITVDVKEVGNKIYVYDAKTPYDQGQYAEVFDKDPGVSLEKAITDQFLTGSYKNNCTVSLSDTPALPEGYDKATIDAKGEFADPSDMFMFAEENCPMPYTVTNGLAYFLTKNDDSDKFIFFSIGQYGIAADNQAQGGKAWQDTIEFLVN